MVIIPHEGTNSEGLEGKGRSDRELDVRELEAKDDRKPPYIMEDGISILVAQGELSLTGEQYAQWYREKFLQ